MKINTKTKLGMILASIYGIYLGYLLISTWRIDTTIIPPENCRRIASLPSVRYSDSRFFAILKQKRKVSELGGNALYLPPSIDLSGSDQGYLAGIAYHCP